ncbi:slipin family protein [Leptospira sp. GIMC2001]|uniref:slipin family protein n=1 Tax=Leptospira sp. GIMC2001 TaxID=1513297 RepID=UPI00234A7F41|nr:slipin family protein [Leptospira sp. GIMC2001]WCL48564.1 slipin family protein [Leptospira sp. GIMC2001]
MESFLPLIVIGIVFLSMSVKILKEYERGVIFRLGRFSAVKGPGLIVIIPFIDKLSKISLRTITTDVAPQDVITKDNVSIKVNAVIYFRVVDPARAIIQIEDYLYATLQLSQTTLRSIMGQSELDEILAQRDKINAELQAVIDEQTDAWGVKVTMVEVKHIDLPENMQRAMAKQAEAERERRAKVIKAEGEHQASAKLSEAAQVLESHPISVQLRFLQTLVEIAGDKTSTIVLPIPLDLLSPFMDKLKADNNKK